MTTGEGGMVITKDPELANTIRQKRSHGMTSTTYERFRGHAFGYDVTTLGYNYRMDEIRAAIGIEQLKKLPPMTLLRRKRVIEYRDILGEKLNNVRVPFKDFTGNHGYHIFSILLPPDFQNRNSVMEKLTQHGIQTSIHYHPIHQFTDYRNFHAHVPKTDGIAPRILSLPLFPDISTEQIHDVIDSLKLSIG